MVLNDVVLVVDGAKRVGCLCGCAVNWENNTR